MQLLAVGQKSPASFRLRLQRVGELFPRTLLLGIDVNCLGELFDLEADPGEVNNLWSDPAAADLKSRLIEQLLQAEMGKEPLWMPRIANA